MSSLPHPALLVIDIQVGLLHGPEVPHAGAATLANIGPGYGPIGPMASFADLHPLTKVIFIGNMVVGRLELIPFIAMLHPDFWTFRRA